MRTAAGNLARKLLALAIVMVAGYLVFELAVASLMSIAWVLIGVAALVAFAWAVLVLR